MNPPSTQNFLRTLKFDPSVQRRDPRMLMELTLAQLQRLADFFDLGRVTQMDKPLTTQCNTTDPFKTGRGTFLLRARHGEEFGERVEYLHEIITYLNSHGFPAAEVMRSRTGKSWTTWGERIVEIHRFIPHDPGIHRDWRRMNAAATALGDLHRLLADATAGKTPVPPEMRNDVSPEQCWTLLDDAEATLWDSFRDDPRRVEAANVCQRARKLLEPLLRDYPRIIGNLPWVTVHGDFHFWNVLYRADQIAAVVDYDFVQERERIFDIAYALQNVINHLRQVHSSPLYHWEDLSWNNVRLWVDLYDEASHLPLTAAERRWLPKEILRIFLVGVATSILQEDPLDLLVKHGSDLDLFAWISEQDALFA
jgi:Ser/Thr protein kinase RdoA (MazF antagonist)